MRQTWGISGRGLRPCSRGACLRVAVGLRPCCPKEALLSAPAGEAGSVAFLSKRFPWDRDGGVWGTGVPVRQWPRPRGPEVCPLRAPRRSDPFLSLAVHGLAWERCCEGHIRVPSAILPLPAHVFRLSVSNKGALSASLVNSAGSWPPPPAWLPEDQAGEGRGSRLAATLCAAPPVLGLILGMAAGGAGDVGKGLGLLLCVPWRPYVSR